MKDAEGGKTDERETEKRKNKIWSEKKNQGTTKTKQNREEKLEKCTKQQR